MRDDAFSFLIFLYQSQQYEFDSTLIRASISTEISTEVDRWCGNHSNLASIGCTKTCPRDKNH